MTGLHLLHLDVDLAALSAAIYADTWTEVFDQAWAIRWHMIEMFDHADAQAALFRHPVHSVEALVFRGTEPSPAHVGDWAANARVWPTRWPGRGWVHAGYADHLSRVLLPARDMARLTKWPVLVTGHSMGGALATLFASLACTEGHAPAALVSFGAPKVFFGAASAQALTCPVRRYAVTGDPAPIWPPLPGYHHPAHRHALPAPPPLAGPLARHDPRWYARAVHDALITPLTTPMQPACL
jgi:hypothetical protein